VAQKKAHVRQRSAKVSEKKKKSSPTEAFGPVKEPKKLSNMINFLLKP